MRRYTLLAVALLAMALTVFDGRAGATTQQFTWVEDQQVVHAYNRYAELTQSPTTPPNWTSPVNYAAGTVFARLEIVDKPSDKPLDSLLCVWRDSFSQETCKTGPRIATEGVYWVNYGSVYSWWKKNGSFSWATPFSPVRIMFKDPNTGKLMQTERCGTACSTPSAVEGHIPITVRMSSVVVASGATLAPPAGWTGCPAAWSPACSSTTPTTVESTTTTTTTAPPSGPKVVVLAGGTSLANDKPIVSRLQALGKEVTVVDDDAFSAASLSGASMLAISSSVVPTKLPTWLATSAVPILNAEAYAQARLSLATGASEAAGQTTARIVDASHPLAAGRSGDVVVQSSAPIAVGTPSAGAAVVARRPGTTAAMIYGVEKGAALTNGTANARRVGFFFSYESPLKLTSAGWSLFDAAVRWLTPTIPAAEAPDLVVTSVSWTPSPVATGNDVRFTAIVHNQGSGSTPAGVVLGVLFKVDGSGVTWSDTHTSPLSPGESVTLSASGGRNGVATWRATAGSHTIIAHVDDVNRIPNESSETNNTRSAPLNVTG